MTKPVQRIAGTYNGIPCEISASWSTRRNGYEVVLTLNPDYLPGCTRAHKTLCGVSEDTWQAIKAEASKHENHLLVVRS